MKLVFIRHTSVDLPRGICYGNSDVALASTFSQEARAVKDNLKQYTFDITYCSPLSRCVRLAEFCGYPDAIKDSRLKEINFGDWEMKSYDEITGPELQEWFADYINVAPPGGESVVDQRKRLQNFVEEIKNTHPESTAGVFTHGGIIINALVVYGGKSYGNLYDSVPPYGSIIEIEV